VAREHGLAALDGILLDLGLSSLQLADGRRGFSFRAEGPLDMRADPDLSVTAADIVNSWDERELRRAFGELGEETEAGRVAAAIVRRRSRQPFLAADDLGRFVAGVKTQRRRGIDPATRVFQALRIAVNDELGALETALPSAFSMLRPGGRLAVISFHSLEDRIVKRFMRDRERGCECPPDFPVCVCGKTPELRSTSRKAIRPSAAETAANPRSSSARLRVGVKT
jgi:16S rRNA (cytosine1402-N4)-methyltransferase